MICRNIGFFRCKLTDIILVGILSGDTKPNDVLIVDAGRNHVKSARGVDVLQKFAVILISNDEVSIAFQTETD